MSDDTLHEAITQSLHRSLSDAILAELQRPELYGANATERMDFGPYMQWAIETASDMAFEIIEESKTVASTG